MTAHVHFQASFSRAKDNASYTGGICHEWLLADRTTPLQPSSLPPKSDTGLAKGSKSTWPLNKSAFNFLRVMMNDL